MIPLRCRGVPNSRDRIPLDPAGRLFVNRFWLLHGTILRLTHRQHGKLCRLCRSSGLRRVFQAIGKSPHHPHRRHQRSLNRKPQTSGGQSDGVPKCSSESESSVEIAGLSGSPGYADSSQPVGSTRQAGIAPSRCRAAARSYRSKSVSRKFPACFARRSRTSSGPISTGRPCCNSATMRSAVAGSTSVRKSVGRPAE